MSSPKLSLKEGDLAISAAGLVVFALVLCIDLELHDAIDQDTRSYMARVTTLHRFAVSEMSPPLSMPLPHVHRSLHHSLPVLMSCLGKLPWSCIHDPALPSCICASRRVKRPFGRNVRTLLA